MATFVPGLQLCSAFYSEAVQPLLAKEFAGVRYAAARVGQGSEVLGFDTPRSVDHGWGPRLELFLSTEDVRRHGARISQVLAQQLPKSVRGWSTHFESHEDGRVAVLAPAQGPVSHRVLVTDVASWSEQQLGFDATGGVGTLDWLAMPGQRLAEVTGGAVYHDGTGELTRLRERLAWYPDDVWRYLLACQWVRIGEEEPFVGRTAEAGDELGSRVVTARLAREVMRLCLLLSRRYPPYTKWLGTAFTAAPGTRPIAAALGEAVAAADPGRRQAALCAAYEAAGEWQNSLRLADPVEPTRRPFFDRPYPVIDGARFAAALMRRIEDPELASLPPAGGVDQYADSTAVLTAPRLSRSLMMAVGPDPGAHPAA
ncbi:MAG: DUF4037 domain-containing protein [Micromonosporaceae bacterium]|nr:DUF4037 domain-containing protein [Micromonosporaceae bacterium]